MSGYFGGVKRYHTLDSHYKSLFGCKVAKLSLNAGCTCPNIDGKRGFGGCTYCSDAGSGDFAGSLLCSIPEQIEMEKKRLSSKWKDCAYIAYFQAHSNTYGDLNYLAPKFEAALACQGIVGMSIATRADCLADDMLTYLSELNRRTYLTIELGLQSIFDDTGRRIHRGHTYSEFLGGLYQLLSRNIRVCVHLINGLPGESRERMLCSARTVGQLGIGGIKLHLLHVLEKTSLAEEYLQGRFPLLSREEYVSIICDQLELLPPEVVVERLTGDGDRIRLIGPAWSRDKRRILNEIDKELARRNSWQGKCLG